MIYGHPLHPHRIPGIAARASHRLTTLSGSPEQLQMALQKLAENMKTEAETESDEARFAGVRGVPVLVGARFVGAV